MHAERSKRGGKLPGQLVATSSIPISRNTQERMKKNLSDKLVSRRSVPISAGMPHVIGMKRSC